MRGERRDLPCVRKKRKKKAEKWLSIISETVHIETLVHAKQTSTDTPHRLTENPPANT